MPNPVPLWLFNDQGWSGLISPDTAHPIAIDTADAADTFAAQRSPIIVAIPGKWGMPALTDADDSHETMIYALEADLPMVSEELVIDFLPLGDRQLGVAVPLAKLQSMLIDGVDIDHICSLELLALQYRLQQHASEKLDGVIWCDHEQQVVHWFALTNHQGQLRPHAWAILPLQLDQLRQRLAIDPNITDAQVLSLNMPNDWHRALPACNIVTETSDLFDDAMAMTQSMTHHHTAPWIDLARPPLFEIDPWRRLGKSIGIALVCMLILASTLIGGLAYRTHQYDTQRQQHQQQQIALFREIYADQRLPANIPLYLESEQRRYAPTSSSGSPGITGSLPTSVMPLLHQTLTALPTPAPLHYQISDMRFGPDSLTLKGQAVSHVDAESIAAALRKQNIGLTVQPPRTQRDRDNTIQFTVDATREPKP